MVVSTNKSKFGYSPATPYVYLEIFAVFIYLLMTVIAMCCCGGLGVFAGYLYATHNTINKIAIQPAVDMV